MVSLRRRKVECVPDAEVQCEARRNLPIIAHEELGDVGGLEGALVEIEPGVADTKLVERGRRGRPVVVADESIASRDGVPDDSGAQASAALGERGHGGIVIAEKCVAPEEAVLFAEI